jgi:thioredoxin reductase
MRYDVAVIGGGPAGLAAALAADKTGGRVLLIEREKRLGGILKQCIHDGFGLIRYGEKLSGPEYSYRFIKELEQTGVEVRRLTFVTKIIKTPGGFKLTLVNSSGVNRIDAKTLILSTGCRERTARQIGIHGTHPAGVITAGTAQYYTNILGQLPARRCIILGSGDVGLIMARRLSLEGAEVLGVYEAQKTPSGLSRNILQCLEDFNIPLYTGKTVTRVYGHHRLEGVDIASVDGMQPIPGTEKRIPCDGLILSVGLIPENELAETLKVPIHPDTKGPICDQHNMTLIPGVFSCGNAALVNDLVDYVSESGETAGRWAAHFAAGQNQAEAGTGTAPETGRNLADISGDQDILCLAPQKLDLDQPEGELAVFFRVREEQGETLVRVRAGEKELFRRRYNRLRPPEMERVILHPEGVGLRRGDTINFTLEKP